MKKLFCFFFVRSQYYPSILHGTMNDNYFSQKTTFFLFFFPFFNCIYLVRNEEEKVVITLHGFGGG
jgi:hypothetical protein